MRRGIALAAALAALACPATASAQGAVVQAVDGTDANGYVNSWSPAHVTVKAGEAVTWSFTGSVVYHNVESRGTNWSIRNGDPAIAPSPASFTFTTPGVYAFVCQIHADTMAGTVTVTDASGAPPPPPPPPPLSEQPWPNDQQPPGALESEAASSDRTPPRLSHLRAGPVRNGARVRFRLSERADVVVSLKLAGVTVKSKRRTFRAGGHSLTVRDRRMHGRYRVEVVARDRAGNRSPPKGAQVTIR